MKFSKMDELQMLQAQWDQILKEAGFKDIEDRRGNLKKHDTRTIAYQNQSKIREFFLKLDHLLTIYHEMPRFERQVLERYSQGYHIKQIVKETHASDRHVRNVIDRYHGLIAALMRLDN